MQCYIYRSKHKHKTYLFLPRKNDFSEVPDSLAKVFGESEFSFQFELTKNRKLVMADPSEVIESIRTNGFFLQLPPGDEIRLHQRSVMKSQKEGESHDN